MYQSFETPESPLGYGRSKGGTFTLDSFQFGPPLGGERARNQDLRIPVRGISGAVTPWAAVSIFAPHRNYIDLLDGSDHSVIIKAKYRKLKCFAKFLFANRSKKAINERWADFNDFV